MGGEWSRRDVAPRRAALLVWWTTALWLSLGLADAESEGAILGPQAKAGKVAVKDAPCGRFGYMVSVRNRMDEHVCGGVLVDPQWVLTAAHCIDPDVQDAAGSAPVVVVGACNQNDVKNENGKVEIFTPKETILHENYTGDIVDGYDIALMHLKAPSKHVPAALPQGIFKLGDEDALIALGWGLQRDGPRGGDLFMLEGVVATSFDECKVEDIWGDRLQDNMICAVSFQALDICKGDQGGPLLHPYAPGGNLSAGQPDIDVVIGIKTFGEMNKKCSKTTRPSVFMSTSILRDWILATIEGDVDQEERQEELDQSLYELATAPENASTEALVDDLISRGANPNSCCDTDGDGPLHQTGHNDSVIVASALIAAGAEVDFRDFDGDTPLSDAAYFNGSRVVQVLIDAGADLEATDDGGATPLAVAAKRGSTKAAKRLIAAGADPDACCDANGDRPIHQAVERDSVGIVVALIEAGANISARDTDGDTALSDAAIFNAARSAEALIEAGADVNVREDDGNTPLHLAAAGGNVEVAEVLVGADADVNARNRTGATPLHMAAQLDLVAIGELLIGADADPDARDDGGETPLHVAAAFGSVEAAELLVSVGANKTAARDDGATPLEVVCTAVRRRGCDPEKRLDELLS